ncbi:hypothetical protein QYE76_069805 [Lolium multiflorum]|uniref:Uncharacterized protein n=1 Tax=Lolium multiflorum TaxID=4521 RepID=A0AAD8SGX9_LOLMU|nr:hypothetical protein QYE76_069805 [Lolium multiflorum]
MVASSTAPRGKWACLEVAGVVARRLARGESEGRTSHVGMRSVASRACPCALWRSWTTGTRFRPVALPFVDGMYQAGHALAICIGARPEALRAVALGIGPAAALVVPGLYGAGDHRRWVSPTSTHSRTPGTIFNIHHIAIYIRDGGKHSGKREDLADKLKKKHNKAKAVLGTELIGSRRKTIPTTFFVVDSKSTYAVILGRDWIHANCCIPSTMHQCLIQWDGDEVEVVHADDSAEISTAGMGIWEASGQEPLSGINLDDCERIDVTKNGVRLVLSTGLTV